MYNQDNSIIMFMKQLREKQNEIRIELDKLTKNELDANQEEIYLMMGNLVDAVTFLLDFTYKIKEEIDAHFINQKESTELLESKEIYNIVDIKNKKIKKCIMDFFYIELTTCENCNFNKICDWIKKKEYPALIENPDNIEIDLLDLDGEVKMYCLKNLKALDNRKDSIYMQGKIDAFIEIYNIVKGDD